MGATINTQTHYADQVFKDLRMERVKLDSSEFYDCRFICCSFVDSVFSNCRFINCNFKECDLSLVQVPNSVFTAAQFKESKVIGVNWAHANWSATRLQGSIGFYNCVINHSTFIGLCLKEIQIKDCAAVDVDFRESDLSRADFGGTDLSESLFSETNLTEADLSRARNYHINPGRNILDKARFSLPEAMSLLYSMDIVLIEGEG